MTYMGLTALDVPRDLPRDEFVRWMEEGGIQAIYVDHSLVSDNPDLWEKISESIGDGLERVFVAEEGNYQVLVFQE